MTRDRTIREALHRTLADLSTDRSPLDLVGDVPIIEGFVADYVAARIADARATGASWADIAVVLGVSKQAAHKRFTATGKKGHRKAIFELRFTRDPDRAR